MHQPLRLLLLSSAMLWLVVGQPTTTRANNFNILMIGNSYTSGTGATGASNTSFDLQGLFDADTEHAATVTEYSVGGGTLKARTTDSNIIGADGLLTNPSSQWDVIILQEQSLRPALAIKNGGGELFALASGGPVLINNFIDVHQPQADVILFNTWARAPGNSSLIDNFDNDPKQMQGYVNQGYDQIATLSNAWNTNDNIAPVGDAWIDWFNTYGYGNSGTDLHTSDGSHQNQLGSYLAASVLFETITGKTSVGNTYTGGVNGAVMGTPTTLLLQEQASTTTNLLPTPTTLNAGDIAILGVHSAGTTSEFGAKGDEITWVPLVDIEGGQRLYFSDVGYYADDGSIGKSDGTSEGLFKFVVPTGGLAAGEVQTIGRPLSPAPGDYFSPDNAYADQAGISATGINLSASGDQVVVFQDDNLSNTTNFNPLFAVNLASSDWNATTSIGDGNQTNLYPGLTDGESAVAAGSGPGNQDEFDNARYIGISTGKRAELLAAIADVNNWEQTDGTGATDGWTTNSVSQFTILADSADFDGDSYIDGADFLIWQRGYAQNSGAMQANGDANGDGNVDTEDLLIWKTQNGNSAQVLTTASASVPEPATTTIAIFATVVSVSLARDYSSFKFMPQNKYLTSDAISSI